MKNLSFLPQTINKILILFVCLVSSYLSAQVVAIPDPWFEQVLIDEGIDSDNSINGQVLESDVLVVTELNINSAINSFEGLQSFSNLINFYYNGYYNSTSNLSIDFSGNPSLNKVVLEMSINALNQLDFSQNVALEELRVDVSTYNINSIDLSQNINLKVFDLKGLYDLQSLDFTQNPALEELRIDASSFTLQTLDLSPNINLNIIDLSSLYTLQSIELPVGLALEELRLNGFFDLQSLDVSQNTNLKILYLRLLEDLQILDITNLSNLESLSLEALYNLNDLDVSNQISLNEIYIESLSDILTLDLSNSVELNSVDINLPFDSIRAINLKNGFNNLIASLDISANGTCILVDNTLDAENNTSWQIDNSVYTDVLCITPPINDGIDAFDVNANSEIQNWLGVNGNAQVYFYQDAITWDYSFDVSINEFNNIIYETSFVASSAIGNQTTLGQYTLYTSGFTAGEDFVPVNGDVAGGIEAEGALCADESGTFDLNLFNRNDFGEQIDFGSAIYENASVIYQQNIAEGTGGTITSIDDTEVLFPDTGAGKFTYHYTLSVSTNVQYFGMSEPITLTDEADVWHWLTVPFNPGEDKEIAVCASDTITLDDLYAQLNIIDGTDDTEFDPNAYWFDTDGAPITSYNGPGEYIFNAGDFLPECGAIPTTIIVTESSGLTLTNPSEDLTITYDPLTYENQVNTWIQNNGGATADGCGDITWEWELLNSQLNTSVNPDDTTLVCTIRFRASDSNEDEIENIAFLTFYGFPSAGLSLGFGENLCGDESYDLNDISSIDSTSPSFALSIITITQIEGPGLATVDGDEVLFPDTGAGKFTYVFDYNVSTTINIGGQELFVEDSTELTVLELTIPFDPGFDKELTVCSSDEITLNDLYLQFEIVDGTEASNFNPNDYWFNTNGESITSYDGPGEYIFNAEGFLPECGGIPASVTVTEEQPLSAGINGELEICSGETPTEAELFDALISADSGGTWEEVSTGVYTYTHAATACNPSVSATLTLIEEQPKSAGIDGELEICSGETPTETELFDALVSADSGGTWQEVSTGVYTYTHAATACNPSVSATMTLIEEQPKSAGIDGELEICSGETPTETELFDALVSADSGGIWEEVSTGVYIYTHAATACNPSVSSTMTLIEEQPKSAGVDGELEICSGETPTETELFDALVSADSGGTWQEVSAGVYTYTHAATACNPSVSATMTLIEEQPKSAGVDGELEICSGETPTETELFDALVSADSGGTWQEVSTGVYTYTHAATACNPSVSATMTLIEEQPKSAGVDGELEICSGETPTETELFDALVSADSGGTWQEVSTGVYTYTHAATACNPSVSATMTLIEEQPKSAGVDGELEICSGETPTEAELFDALVSADSGGIWEEVSTGVYTYTHAATACNPSVSATMTLIEEQPKSAGVDGELEICSGETPTEAELFDALVSADSGGIWEEVSTGVYTYTHAATPCNPSVSSTMTLIEEQPKSAGIDGELEICPNTNPTFSELFNALGGNPDYGGLWILSSVGVYEYRHIATACNALASATVTLIYEEQKSAGEDGSLELCTGEVPTEAELFNALGGNADTGGIWQEIELGIYEYSFEPSSCYATQSATVTVQMNNILSAGEDGELQIEEGTVVDETQLFNALSGNPDLGGIWSPELIGGGIYTYSHDNGECGEASAIVEVSEVNSISNSAQLDDLLIYPNPSSRFIRLKNEGNVIVHFIEIYTVNGQRVMEIKSNFLQMNIGHLDAALYFVKINTAVGIKMVKLIKN